MKREGALGRGAAIDGIVRARKGKIQKEKHAGRTLRFGMEKA